MKKIVFLIFTLSYLFISCSEPEPQLTFKGIKYKTAKHLGEGVWIKVPPFFKKARTYDGFQGPRYESSISLQVDEATIEEVKKSFSKKVLAQKKTKLITLQDVTFGEQDSAVFSMVHDRRKNTIRYLLSVKKKNRMYGIKAFCFAHLKDKYDRSIKLALESVSFGENLEEKEPFMLAHLVSLEEIIYTRDGEYPTLSDDEGTIRMKDVTKSKKGNSSISNSSFLSGELRKYSEFKESNIHIEKLQNGYFTSAYIFDGELNVFGAFLSDGDEINTLYIGTSTTFGGIKEIGQFIRDNSVKTSIDLR